MSGSGDVTERNGTGWTTEVKPMDWSMQNNTAWASPILCGSAAVIAEQHAAEMWMESLSVGMERIGL